MMQTLKLSLVIILILMVTSRILLAEPIKLSPFALYEQASSNIIIDGVSTKYGLGVAGISLQKNLNDKVTLAGKLGYGQNNDQKVSFSGANFKGLVSGSYLDLQGSYLIYQNDRSSVFGARRRFKTRIGLLAQPNFTRPITRAKVHPDTSISVSAA